MKIVLKKQPQKYLASLDAPTREKLYKALEGLENLEGDIKRLKGYNNYYRLKIHHYRILFTYDSQGQIIIVGTINTRTNIKY